VDKVSNSEKYLKKAAGVAEEKCSIDLDLKYWELHVDLKVH